jgi:hypothetical protein
MFESLEEAFARIQILQRVRARLESALATAEPPAPLPCATD